MLDFYTVIDIHFYFRQSNQCKYGRQIGKHTQSNKQAA